jgi:hypothetical protein
MNIFGILFLALVAAALLTLLAGSEKHDEHQEQEQDNPCETACAGMSATASTTNARERS